MRILHVFRTPVGGLFRHVRDLSRGQQARGHQVGILCDSTTGGEGAARLLNEVEPYCALGVKRIPISRLPGLGDLWGTWATAKHARAIEPDIIHCHGAKGGLYGRLAARVLGIVSVYTPHGGSLHYNWKTPTGAAFLAAEWLLARLGSAMIFVCQYERGIFDSRVGLGGKPNAVVHNGLWPEEFVESPARPNAADVVFVGDMRGLKGVDVLIEALARCNRKRRTTAMLVGDGPDIKLFQDQVKELGLMDCVTFAGRMGIQDALAVGRILAMPSRAESFPYVVLEAIAAGKPMIASDVGGIPEILDQEQLVPAGDAYRLATHLEAALENPGPLAIRAAKLRDTIRARFTVDAMAEGALSLYRRVLKN